MTPRLLQATFLLCLGLGVGLGLETTQVHADGLDKLEGSAAPVLRQALSKVMVDCPTGSGKCSEASLVDDASLFYGSFEGSDDKYALAFITLQSGGSGDGEEAILLRADKDDKFKFAAKGDVIGGSPRDVRFRKNDIYYVGTIMGPNDSHANPSTPKAFSLTIHDRQITSNDAQLIPRQPQWVLFDEASVKMPLSGEKIALDENYDEAKLRSRLSGMKVTTDVDEGRTYHSFSFPSGDGGFSVYENPQAAPHIMAILSNNAANVLGVRTGMRANQVPLLGPNTCETNELLGTYQCKIKGYIYLLDINKCGLDPSKLPEKPTYVDDCMIVEYIGIGDY